MKSKMKVLDFLLKHSVIFYQPSVSLNVQYEGNRTVRGCLKLIFVFSQILEKTCHAGAIVKSKTKVLDFSFETLGIILSGDCKFKSAIRRESNSSGKPEAHFCIFTEI